MRESLPLVRKGEKESDVIILDGFDVDFPSVFLKIPNEIFPKFDKAYNSAYNQNLGLGETFLFSAGITGLFACGIFSRLEIFPLHLASLTTALYGEVLFGIPVKGEIDSFFLRGDLIY